MKNYDDGNDADQRSARAGRPAGRAGPGRAGPGLEISVFKRAGPGRARDFTGRHGPGLGGPENRGKSPNSKSKRYVLGPVYE